MKRKTTLLSLFALACAASTNAFAEVFTVETDNTAITPFSKNVADFDIYATGSTSKKARIGTTNGSISATYHPLSMTFKAGGETIPDTAQTSITPSEWNLLGNYSFDINSSSGVTTIIKNEASTRVNYQLGTMTVQNSAAEITDASALIDFGSDRLIFNGATKDQRPTLNIYTDTTIKTTNTNSGALYFYRTCFLNVSNSSTLTVDGNVRFGASDTVVDGDWDKRPHVDVANNSKIVFSKTTTFYNTQVTADSTSSLQFAAGFTALEASNFTIDGNVQLVGTTSISGTSSFTTNGTFSFNAALTVDSDATFYAANLNHSVGRTFTVKGSATIASGDFAQTVINGGSLIITNADQTQLRRTFELTNNGTAQTAGYLKINGNADPESPAWAALTINEGSHFYVNAASNPRVIIQNGEIVFNAENALSTSGGNPIQIVNMNSSVNARLRVNASQTFYRISANTQNIDVYLSTENESTLTSFFRVSAGGKLIIHDFDEERIFVMGMSNFDSVPIADPNEVFTAFRTVNESEEQIDTLYIVDGWLSAIAPIPEPATWAALLGAITLGFAAYRRRK